MEKQEMMKMMERLLATINAKKEEMNTNNKTMLAKVQVKAKANTKIMLEEMQKEAEAYREDIKEIKSGQEKMRKEIKSGEAEIRAIIKAWSSDLKINREETMACQEKTEARLEEEELASVDIIPEVAQEQEVTLEDAVEMPVREPKKGRRDRRNLAAVRRQKEQDQNLEARRRRKGKEKGPEEKCFPKELSRSPQRDDPSCASDTTQLFINKGHDPGIL
jgi:hypothetical protein